MGHMELLRRQSVPELVFVWTLLQQVRTALAGGRIRRYFGPGVLGQPRTREWALGRLRSRPWVLGRLRSGTEVLGRTHPQARVLGRPRTRAWALGRPRTRVWALGRPRSRPGVLGRLRSGAEVLERPRSGPRLATALMQYSTARPRPKGWLMGLVKSVYRDGEADSWGLQGGGGRVPYTYVAGRQGGCWVSDNRWVRRKRRRLMRWVDERTQGHSV